MHEMLVPMRYDPMRCTARDARSDEMQWLRDCDFLINNIKSYGGRESPVSSSWDESGEGSWSCSSSKSNVSDVGSPKFHVLIGDVDRTRHNVGRNLFRSSNGLILPAFLVDSFTNKKSSTILPLSKETGRHSIIYLQWLYV